MSEGNARMSLSDRDRELAKKHALHVDYIPIGEGIIRVATFSPIGLAAILAERDQLAIKEKDDAVRYRWLRYRFASPLSNKLIKLSEIDDVDNGNLDAAIDNAIRALIPAKETKL